MLSPFVKSLQKFYLMQNRKKGLPCHAWKVIVCNPPFLLFSLQPHFKKGGGGGGGGLTGSQVLEGSYWERGGDFVQGTLCTFYINNKLKSEILNDKKSLYTKMLFSVVTNNLFKLGYFN